MNSRLFGAGATLCVLALVGAAPVPASASSPSASASASAQARHGLPLGAADLSETRTTRTLQPGVTLTRIVRGADAPAMAWTVEVSIPGGAGSPDPDAPPTALKDEESAGELVTALHAAGFDARSEQVTTAATADYAGGTLGWRVRVGTFTTEAAATAERTRLRAAGYTGSAWYTGWDGNAGDRGPWHVDVLTVDPKKFHGDLKASFGADLENRETTSALAAADGASAGINAGFFVLDPKAGAPGDPAGVGVYDGRLLSEAVNGRPGLVVHDSARGTAVTRFAWRGSVGADGTTLPLDGIDRVPGLIRNCGGTADDLPTARPLHDTTCTDPDELVAFTAEFGKETPKGDGAEAVLDRTGRVVEVRSPRGGALPAGGRSVQATGSYAARLTALAKVGQPLRVTSELTDRHGRPVATSRTTSVLNGGPELVRDGRLHVTPATDGMVQAGNPSFYYGWVHKRNPRTLAGTDAAGRTVLVTADGRSTGSLGLSIKESADVARALGLRDAINLDGGGSTTMVVDGQVINDPSDAAGERPVGDALLILPGSPAKK
ncbi:phosphodiester glycosidase family protein [Streptomyces sp. VRA16 Mangrove soil]|uniref:phosphodiester glycosidase family protein n=1 Tax=Streptomyces sp. VRA16 Mangrove soil TaxID=2817434 RepID=UPI001A9F4F38|nr:phosphodiester glycosidase family protein [Streptomyces sp. VRA16 Mangrove soil]MBO1334583.1 phosphodiester glycosidase family protein [Streptomyces sp. VRA16 Mangrove soil]